MALDDLTAATFRTLSAARDARIFHPGGVAFAARWQPVDVPRPMADSPLVRAPHDAIVRYSRAVGLPPPAPDILGLAVKVLDVHGEGRDQDLLLASSGTSLLRFILVPWRDFSTATFSSLLPYAIGDGRAVITARAVPSATRATFDEIRSGDAPPPTVTVELRTLSGRRITLAHVAPGERYPDEVARDMRFDPWHTGPRLQPTGLLNRLRRPAYVASQEGRDAPAAGAREHIG